MARLPKPGSDAGQWGDILNNYLNQAHKADGTLKDDTVGTAQLQTGSVGSVQLQDESVAEAKLAPTVQDKLNSTPEPPTIADVDGLQASLDSKADIASLGSAATHDVEEFATADPALSLMSWRTAFANRDIAPATIVCIGDSITEYHGASQFHRRWPMRLAAMLRGQYQLGQIPGGIGYLSPTVVSGTPRFTWLNRPGVSGELLVC